MSSRSNLSVNQWHQRKTSRDFEKSIKVIEILFADYWRYKCVDLLNLCIALLVSPSSFFWWLFDDSISLCFIFDKIRMLQDEIRCKLYIWGFYYRLVTLLLDCIPESQRDVPESHIPLNGLKNKYVFRKCLRLMYTLFIR